MNNLKANVNSININYSQNNNYKLIIIIRNIITEKITFRVGKIHIDKEEKNNLIKDLDEEIIDNNKETNNNNILFGLINDYILN